MIASIMRRAATAARFLTVAAACAAGAAQAQSADGYTDIWHRNTLTGNWCGLGDDLADKGIAISATYTAEVFGNVQGGIHRGATYDGLFLPQLDIDLAQLLKWEGASFRASMVQGHGPSLSGTMIGNLMIHSGTLAVPPATRLYNLWLQQNLFGDVLSVRAGLMNVDAEFMTSATAGLFVNTTFGWTAWTGFDLPAGGPAYPLSGPGIRVRVRPNADGPYLMVAGFSGDPSGHNGSNSLSTGIPSETVVSFTGGTFLIGEIGYAVNQAKDAKGSPLALKLGGWYHTSSRFGDQRFGTDGLSLANPASNGRPLLHNGDWGVYGVADARLFDGADGGALSGFTRVGTSPSDRNLVGFYVDAGLTYQGLIPVRGDDTVGISVAYTRISDKARGLDQDVRLFSNPANPIRTGEVVFEMTYQAQLTPWLTFQPDVQYILNPGGTVLNADGRPRRDAMAIGLRSAVTF